MIYILKKPKIYSFFEERSLHSLLNFNFLCWYGFQSRSSFCGKNLYSTQDIVSSTMFRRHSINFTTKALDPDYFPLIKFSTIFTIPRLLFEPRYYFHEYFLVKGDQVQSDWQSLLLHKEDLNTLKYMIAKFQKPQFQRIFFAIHL